MPSTDPARELAELFDKLTGSASISGDEYLADVFSVGIWSSEFFQIVFCIMERCDFVSEILDSVDIDPDIREDAKRHINQLKLGFSRTSLLNVWNNQSALAYINKSNIQPLKMLSGYVRTKVTYPLLTDEERLSLIAEVSQLKEWLTTQQLVEHDFIRQAIIDGIEGFHFRLERFQWLGWGYTVQSLREVIGAYYALESAMPPDNSSPVAEAILIRVQKLVERVYKAADATKSTYEIGEFMLKAYGAYSLFLPQGISGLLTGPA